MNIYAGNLSDQVTEEDLQSAFESYGNVNSVNLIKDRFSGESRGFGFIEMPVKEEGIAAIKGLDGSDMKGKNIRVNEALPKDNKKGKYGSNSGRRSGGGGRGGDRGHGKRW
ncbi:MAG: RNA-binding protein [Spirochaetes bacterium]|nr:RNA-binding protein [Spirochaetota bacterium]